MPSEWFTRTWVEAVEDIFAAKKRLVSLGSADDYQIGDSSEQRFVDLMIALSNVCEHL